MYISALPLFSCLLSIFHQSSVSANPMLQNENCGLSSKLNEKLGNLESKSKLATITGRKSRMSVQEPMDFKLVLATIHGSIFQVRGRWSYILNGRRENCSAVGQVFLCHIKLTAMPIDVQHLIKVCPYLLPSSPQ